VEPSGKLRVQKTDYTRSKADSGWFSLDDVWNQKKDIQGTAYTYSENSKEKTPYNP